jgi:glycosyltransferase involved in cell wall biosynthesis
MSLSLCMIVKNERENLPRCLDSVRDIVDEMIVVDTGSADDTARIAESYGAKVYHFPWNGSFSDARNYSLGKASCDWILLMDADDELEPSQKRDVLELVAADEADAYFFLTVSYLGETPGLDVMNNLNIRLLRNGRGYFFSNPIHEQIYTNIMAVNPGAVILNRDIKVYHYGYLNKNVKAQDKRKRNIEILEKELEQNPGYGFALFNLGNEYFALGDNRRALEYYEASHAKFDPPQGYSSKLLLKLANCYMNLGRYEEALGVIGEGRAHYPECTDLVFIQALIFHVQRRPTVAIRHFEECARMGEAPLHLCVIAGAGTYRAHYMLGEIHYQLEDYERAAEHYMLSLKTNARFAPSVGKAVHAFCRGKPGKKELAAFLDSLTPHDSGEFDCDIAGALIDEGRYEQALSFIKQAVRTNHSAGLEYRRGLCVLMLKKYRSAHAVMERVRGDPEYAAKAVCMQALCLMLEKDLAGARALLEGFADPCDPGVRVYAALRGLLETGERGVLSDDEKGSQAYAPVIFELLGLLIDLHEFDAFDRALQLLNAVEDKTVLLKLGLLYYRKGCYGLAYKELIRSIKTFDCIDAEGAAALHALKLRGAG